MTEAETTTPAQPTEAKPQDNGDPAIPDPIRLDGQPDGQGFVQVNAPLEVYTPSSDDDVLQGYVLRRMQPVDERPFYVVQLTAKRAAWQPGQLVAVFEDDSNICLANLLPSTQAVGHAIKMVSVWHVKLTPRRLDDDRIVTYVKTLRVGADADPPAVMPPPFPVALG